MQFFQILFYGDSVGISIETPGPAIKHLIIQSAGSLEIAAA